MKRFSYYQLAFLLLLLSLTLTGCQSRDKAPVQRQVAEMSFRDTIETAPDTLFSETRLMAERGAVLQRTRDIFSVIRNYQLSTGGLVMTELLDKAYCSKAWNNMLLAVRRKEFQTNTLFFEIDYWTMTRDPGYVTYDEFEVTQMVIDGQRMMASVDFTVFEMNTYCPARVDMVYEDGQWVIDNFYDMKYMVDVRGSMLQYLVSDVM